ncbi:MAG: N-acetylmuramoyl-L-alanine amidase [Candidatus Gracilibacteria bacterium]
MKERFLIFRTPTPPLSRREGASDTPKTTPEVTPPPAAKAVEEKAKLERGGLVTRESAQDQRAAIAAEVAEKTGFETVPGITPEKLKAARSNLKSALSWIQSKLSGKSIAPRFKIDYNNPDRYLPLMIKESKLSNEVVSRTGAVGYFQLKNRAILDVNKFFHLSITAESVKNPLNNCIAGILFYHICVDQYAAKQPFAKLPEGQRRIIGHMMYNKGYSGIKKLWERSGQKTFDSFERKVADELARQLGIPAGPAARVRDPHFNVDYKEYPAIPKYTELWTKKDRILSKKFTINGKNSGLTIGQVGEVLRYGRIIEGISATEKLSTSPLPNKAPTPPDHVSYKIDELTKEHSLWSMADKLMKECQKKGMNGFDDLQTHIERQNMRKILMDAIVDFNMANNPEFKTVPDDLTGYVFKPGTKFFIPGKEYVKFVMDSLGEKEKTEAVDARKKYQKPETKEVLGKIPMYTDPNLKKEGIAKLENKYGLKEKDIPTYVNAAGEQELAQSRWYWTRRGKLLKKPRIDKPVLRKETKYIILHSTISRDGDGAKKEKKAHYVVEKDGSITYVLDRRYYLNHAGKTADLTAQARWGGDDRISMKSIGIEVVAQKGEEWNRKQYESIKKLVHLLGSIYGIEARNVLTHSQVAMNTFRGVKFRGRKSDPININWALLGLPDNSKLIDQDVALGLINPNLEGIRKASRKRSGDWYGYREDKLVGLRAATKIAQAAGRAPRISQKITSRERTPFVIYKVKRGDTISSIARKKGTTVEQIRKDNPIIKRDKISPGMILKIRK